VEKEHGTNERLTVDLGGHVVSNTDANHTEQERVFAVQVKQRGPMHFTLLHVSNETPPIWRMVKGCMRICEVARLMKG